MINEVLLIGNAGKDAEQVGEHKFIVMSLATSERYQDKSGEWKDSTEWHSVKLSGYTFDKAKEIKKGDKILVKGKITTYERDGIKSTQIVAFKLINFSQRDRQVSSSGAIGYQSSNEFNWK